MNANQNLGSGVDSGDSAPAGPPGAQAAHQTVISSVDQLKALADPIRLAILETLMRDAPELPVMSVKELAEALGEPQTKLYRHVRQLEAAGLIKIAATRLVSGIAEQRYQASQQDLDLADGLLRQHMDETEAVLRAILDRFRRQFFAAFRASEPSADDGRPRGGKLGRNTALMTGYGRLAPAQVADVQARLQEALANFDHEESTDPAAVEMNLLVGYFIPTTGSQD